MSVRPYVCLSVYLSNYLLTRLPIHIHHSLSHYFLFICLSVLISLHALSIQETVEKYKSNNAGYTDDGVYIKGKAKKKKSVNEIGLNLPVNPRTSLSRRSSRGGSFHADDTEGLRDISVINSDAVRRDSNISDTSTDSIDGTPNYHPKNSNLSSSTTLLPQMTGRYFLSVSLASYLSFFHSFFLPFFLFIFFLHYFYFLSKFPVFLLTNICIHTLTQGLFEQSV